MRGRLGAISGADFEFQTLQHERLEIQRIRLTILNRSGRQRCLCRAFARGKVSLLPGSLWV
jgi:hypothetical protein